MKFPEGENNFDFEDEEDEIDESELVVTRAMEGLYKAFSDSYKGYIYPQVYKQQIEIDGVKEDFTIIAGINRDGKDHPESIIIATQNFSILYVTKAQWDRDWPKIEWQEGFIAGVPHMDWNDPSLQAMSVDEKYQISYTYTNEEQTKILDKLAMGLRFQDVDMEKEEQ